MTRRKDDEVSANPIVSERIRDIECDIRQCMHEIEHLEMMNASGTIDEDANLERVAELELYLEKLSNELWLISQNR